MLTCCRLSLSWSSPSWSITIFYLSDQVDIHKFPMLSLHHHSYYINLIYQTKFAVLAILSAFPSRINKFGQQVIPLQKRFRCLCIARNSYTGQDCKCGQLQKIWSSYIFSILHLLDPSECTMRKVQVIPMQHLQSSVICLPTSHPINLLVESKKIKKPPSNQSQHWGRFWQGVNGCKNLRSRSEFGLRDWEWFPSRRGGVIQPAIPK